MVDGRTVGVAALALASLAATVAWWEATGPSASGQTTAAAALPASAPAAADPADPATAAGSADAPRSPATTAAGGPAPTRSPLTPSDPARITPQAQLAIARLASTAGGVPAAHEGHSHGPAAMPTASAVAAVRASLDWSLAVAVAATIPDPDAAIRLGYVRASTPAPGVGTHYVKWTIVGKEFNAGAPAMLLFDERPGRPARLVGFSYWVGGVEAPVGFEGDLDIWHQHAGLCVVNGWVDREDVPDASQCAGAWLGGADLWMLHAWVVPGFENRWGPFSPTNPRLCPPAVGTPDLARCDAT